MIYFTSDMHFGHKNVIDMCSRPFRDIDQMDQALISNWNNLVTHEDEVYILGDIALTNQWEIIYEYLRGLKGKKYLVKGNHDHFVHDEKFIENYFELVTDYHEVLYNDQRFILFHYPLWDWNGKYRDSISLYGHIHAKDSLFLQEQFGRCFHVGVDSNNFAPVSAEEIITAMASVQKCGFMDELFHNMKTNTWGLRRKLKVIP